MRRQQRRRVAFIAMALVGSASYICVRVHREPKALRDLGLRGDGLGPAFLAISLLGLVMLVAMAWIARTRPTLEFRWQMLALLMFTQLGAWPNRCWSRASSSELW